MKLFLHIGSGRTGSQALQHFLKWNAQPLASNGIHYPILNGKNHHNPLALPLCRSTPPRYLANLYGTDFERNCAHFETYVRSLRELVDAESPDALVLSSEFLSRPFDEADGRLLFRRLREITDDIDVVLYLRNPADYYLSAAIQTLKASAALKPPSHQPVREIVSNYLREQPAKIHVREYHRELLVGNDICTDFVSIVAPGIEKELKFFGRDRNASPSAEVMSIVQKYRRVAWPDSDNKFNAETDRLVEILIAYAKDHELYRKPRLKAGIARALNTANDDAHWLARELGFRFHDVDYTRENDAKELRIPVKYLDDVCSVDPETRDRILFGVFAHIYHSTKRGEPAD